MPKEQKRRLATSLRKVDLERLQPRLDWRVPLCQTWQQGHVFRVWCSPGRHWRMLPVCFQPCEMNSIRASLMCVLIRESYRSVALLLTFPMTSPSLICNSNWLSCRLRTISCPSLLLPPLSSTSTVFSSATSSVSYVVGPRKHVIAMFGST